MKPTPEIWISTSDGDYEVRGRKFGSSYDTVMPAPKGAVVIAPDTCPTCNGKGNVSDESATWGYVPTATAGKRKLHCPDCAGRGYVWPDELVDRLAEVLASFDEEETVLWVRRVPFVLDALLGDTDEV